MLYFPPFLGGIFPQFDSPATILLPFISFCAAASSIYIINDLSDLQQDIHHPTKCRRPLPAGMIKPPVANLVAFVLIAGALFFGWAVSDEFLLFLVAYLLISVVYSWRLKDVPIVELFCVVSGFLLRLLAGGEAFSVPVSGWLFLSVFLLALFLVCGKRLSELCHEGGRSPAEFRPVLSRYPKGFLEGGMFMSGAAVLVTYTMYVLAHPVLVYTVPLCFFGLMAYLLRVLSGQGGDPTRALLHDPVIFLVCIVWVCLVGYAIYGV
jgi:4-hydroxybenzoate polyprenyltransferase